MGRLCTPAQPAFDLCLHRGALLLLQSLAQCCCCPYRRFAASLLPLLRRLIAGARALLFAHLFIRFIAFVRFSCLDGARRWRSVRRAAALLVKAAAAAASGKLLPCIACAFTAARRRMLPLTLPSAEAILDLVFFTICCPPSSYLDSRPLAQVSCTLACASSSLD